MGSDLKYINISATRLSTYLLCKWKYWCNYVLHLPRKPNISFKLGLPVHEALATAGKIWQEKNNFSKEDVKMILDTYNTAAAREGLADTSVYNDGLNMVTKRIKNFAQGEILTVEEKFRITTDEGIILIGAMDKVEQLREDTILVVDYKTSKYFETYDELKSDIQLSIYDAVAFLKYPQYKRIILSLDYLRGEPVYTYRTSEERENFLNYLTAIYSNMLSLTEKEAIPVLNPMCNWCDFSDHCDAYRDAFSTKSFIKAKLEEYKDDELVKDYMDIKNRKRILDNKEQEIRQFILHKIEANSQDIVGDGKELYIRQNTLVNYDPKTVYENLPLEEFLNAVSINKNKVDAYLERNPSVRSKILATADRHYGRPFVAYRNKK